MTPDKKKSDVFELFFSYQLWNWKSSVMNATSHAIHISYLRLHNSRVLKTLIEYTEPALDFVGWMVIVLRGLDLLEPDCLNSISINRYFVLLVRSGICNVEYAGVWRLLRALDARY